MTDMPRDIHYRDHEFLYKNVHYDAGWYFYDEEEDLYGPFLSKHQCEVALQMYLRQLEAGVAPTQLKNPKLLRH